MLRSGYSNEAVQRELSVRHLAETCDAAGEAALRGAGASPSLIDAIKSGAYQTSQTDALAALEQRTAQAQRAGAGNGAIAQDGQPLPGPARPRTRGAAPPRKHDPPWPISSKATWFTGTTEAWARFDDDTFGGKKLIALYFCRQLVRGLPSIHPAAGRIL